MNIAYKLGMVGLGGVAATTGAYAGSRYLRNNKSSVAHHLEESGYKLISSIDNSEHLKLQWQEEFKSDKEKIKTLIGFSQGSDEDGGKALEAWCNINLKKEYLENSKELEGVKNYCVLRTIESQLSRDNNKKILTDDSGDNTKWENTYNKRKETTTLSPRSQVGLTGEWAQHSNSKDEDLKIIKPWCKAQSKSHFLAYQQTYTHVNNWCTEGGANVAT
ncbi:hypothetical protein HF1_04710 [Mycoplasma haemofelis str. Langford 1]|uniref:Uncharacterized protein n=1 Tax=Mycoplasma haemofelis (strain Langford 1) TaxID=941640 RepID=E8ZH58_MYCHL|nr:hypothetical protein [Mycoplasma haemofelis]CBY92479.1 hypothetical protein HF1_04710 [Mycoplasma haemofelis str. Langford 1]